MKDKLQKNKWEIMFSRLFYSERVKEQQFNDKLKTYE